jgi:hypothetical protein
MRNLFIHIMEATLCRLLFYVKEIAARYCQVSGCRAVLVEPDGVIPPLSAGTRRLSPVTEDSVAEESIMTCFEMVPTDPEQVLNRTL